MVRTLYPPWVVFADFLAMYSDSDIFLPSLIGVDFASCTGVSIPIEVATDTAVSTVVVKFSFVVHLGIYTVLLPIQAFTDAAVSVVVLMFSFVVNMGVGAPYSNTSGAGTVRAGGREGSLLIIGSSRCIVFTLCFVLCSVLALGFRGCCLSLSHL